MPGLLSRCDVALGRPPLPVMREALTAAASALDSSATTSAFHRFGERYRDDFAAFAVECIRWPAGESLTAYQLETLRQVTAAKRVCVRGPHGLGKSTLAAITVLAFALTRSALGTDWKVITTAGAWRQLVKYLWPEVHKWGGLLRWDVIGRAPLDLRTELLTQSLKLRGGEAFPIASNDHEKLEGAHASSVLVVFDESKAIEVETWDALEGVFSNAGTGRSEAFAVAISTPGVPAGRFHEIQSRKAGTEDWWVRHVTLTEAVAAGRISQEWADQRARQWGVGSAVYQNRVLGEFATSEEDGVIPLAWVEAAIERWDEWVEAGRPGEFVGVGTDVARSGADKTVHALRFGNVVAELRKHRQEDSMATVGQVVGIIEANGNRGTAAVDVIGWGAGVVDRLREQGRQVLAFNAAEGTDRRDRSGELAFRNTRSAAWWNLREMLDPANGENVALPPDDELIGDLTAPRWVIGSGGKVEVESKDSIRKRLGRSTDCGDAVVQVMWIAPVTAPQRYISVEQRRFDRHPRNSRARRGWA